MELIKANINDFLNYAIEQLIKGRENKNYSLITQILQCLNELLSSREVLKMQLKSHKSEDKSNPIIVKVQMPNVKVNEKTYDLNLFENTLLYDLRSEISKRAHQPLECVLS